MIGVVVLAAGGSRRLGRAKQLVVWEGETLLRRAARTALGSACGPVVVVLGHRFEEMRREVSGLDVRVVVCEEWEQGMGRSLAWGIRGLVEGEVEGELKAAIVMTCDQPLVTAGVLNRLIEEWAEGRLVAACEYAGTVGVPALFDASLFEELMALKGDRGAKGVIRKHGESLGLVQFSGGEIDVDAPGDLP
ncbi:MAG TPA: nucleotidyltransferase family protein [Acidobacteriota bacterium]|nr:nucleotidyltransferase family protein [Acidobacteriota bacterium]